MSQRIVIFGNSGSGKSTLAKYLAKKYSAGHLDLDTVAWQHTVPPSRRPLDESERAIRMFCQGYDNWIIEGCYADLIEIMLGKATELIFLNLSVEHCIANAKQRPWEPHKYESKAAQDANLQMLIEWIAAYPTRDDTFSQKAHEKLFHAFNGKKMMHQHNVEII